MRELFQSPLFPDAHLFPGTGFGVDEIEARIPHRAPMRLVDRVAAVDIAGGRALGVLAIRHDDPVLRGHFPGHPVYPGVLQVEAMGQLGLCLHTEPELRPRVVRILDARFLRELCPGDEARLEVRVLDSDALLGRLAGQVWVGEQLCSAVILEIYFA